MKYTYALVASLILSHLAPAFAETETQPKHTLTVQEIEADVRTLMHVLDEDFWKAVDATGREVDMEYDPSAQKNVNGAIILASGVGMVSIGVIRELAVRAYPGVPAPMAFSRYRRAMGQAVKQFIGRLSPRTSGLYRAWAKLEIDPGFNEAERLMAGAKIIPAWIPRTLWIGGGALITMMALAHFYYIDEELPRERSLEKLRKVFGEGRSEEEIRSALQNSPELAEGLHALADALSVPLQR